MEAYSTEMRSGIGYDVHPLVPGRKLILGGVEIPFDKGLDGWSDADVLSHAVIESLLGAAALGDIGSHFPPGEPEYHNISSLELLSRTGDKLAERGWQVNNIDATVIAERPRLREHIDSMREKLAQALNTGIGRISIKASTNNGLGFVGRGDGIAALAIASIEGK